MAFLDKVSKLATQAQEKAGDALEAGKLIVKIKEEEKAIKDKQLEIGRCIVEKLDDGQEFDERITELYKKILDSRAKIAEYKEEQAKNGEVTEDGASAE